MPRLAPVTTTLYRRGRVRSPQDPFATALLVDDAIVAWVGSESAADAMSAKAMKAPWHFKLMIAAIVLYLGFRAAQGIEWLVR